LNHRAERGEVDPEARNPYQIPPLRPRFFVPYTANCFNRCKVSGNFLTIIIRVAA